VITQKYAKLVQVRFETMLSKNFIIQYTKQIVTV